MNLKNFLLGGNYLDTDWLWNILDAELPPKPDVATSRPGKTFVVVVTDVARGTAMYLEPSADNLRYYLKASSAMPILYRKVLTINGVPVIDGGVADSIPVQEAVRRGANKILVLRSRPSSYVKRHNLVALIFMKVFYYRRRALQKTFKQRPEAYMNAVRFISNPPHGLVVRQLEPSEPMKLARNTVDPAILEEVYRQGISAGKRFVVEYKTVGFGNLDDLNNTG